MNCYLKNVLTNYLNGCRGLTKVDKVGFGLHIFTSI